MESLDIRSPRRYGFWQAVGFSFYSRELYRDVKDNWKGTGLGFLFFIWAVVGIPRAVQFQSRDASHRNPEIRQAENNQDGIGPAHDIESPQSARRCPSRQSKITDRSATPARASRRLPVASARRAGSPNSGRDWLLPRVH